MSDTRHKNYEILNLIGYGLAKFDMDFVRKFGFDTKTAFYNRLIAKGVADTVGTIKNRQDLFDPFFDNKRKGWWQKGNTYLHRKVFIDSLFMNLDAAQFANVVKLYMSDKFGVTDKTLLQISPVVRSKFKQLQTTGQEAELYFMHNFEVIEPFKNGILEDARLFGDGYDFQIQIASRFVLVEIKGVRAGAGSVRLTENEFTKAKKYKDDYGLVVVSNLETLPKMTSIFNPVVSLALKKQITTNKQTSYHSTYMVW
ncbi:MAG: DUF3883 domain-containing protein [Anaerolineaceae bacterium]|nr:MAG: DUF3883 domain-containing protein [Anaerolineaceae bacterium]